MATAVVTHQLNSPFVGTQQSSNVSRALSPSFGRGTATCQPHQITLKHPLECYKEGDSGTDDVCIASIDSPDWKLRAISILATDTLMGLFEEFFRKPMLAETIQLTKSKPQEPVLFYRFPHQILSEEEQKRFVKLPPDGKIEDRFLLLRISKFQDIIRDTFRLLGGGWNNEPGLILDHDLWVRTMNLFNKYYAPERKCVEELIRIGKSPELPLIGGKKGEFKPTFFIFPFSDECFRRMRNSGKFDCNWTDAMVEPWAKDHPNDDVVQIFRKGFRPGGKSPDGLMQLPPTW